MHQQPTAAASDAEPDAASAVEQLVSLLDLERLDENTFRAWNPHNLTNRSQGSLFGGQVAAHAVRAAVLTVDEPHLLHSLHGYFLRPGRDGAATVLQVERIRDGRSFTTRTVTALQGDEPIFALTASFHRVEPGGDFATPIAVDVPLPDQLLADGVTSSRSWGPHNPFDRLEVPGLEHGQMGTTPRHAMWIRTRAALPDVPGLHVGVLTFLSDMGVLGAVRTARGGTEAPSMAASLDHAVWFHRPARADEWLLYDVAARASHLSRGLGLGTLHTAAGVHVATVAQEGLIRLPA